MRTLVLLRAPLVVALALAGLTSLGGVTTGPAYASGTSYTWIGNSQSPSADNHSWTDPDNWEPNGIPGTGDSVKIDAPDPLHCTVGVDGIPAVSLSSLTVTATGCGTTLTGGPITVTGSFVWDGGRLNGDLTVDGTGSVSGLNSHLNTLNGNLTIGGTMTLSHLADSGASNQGGLRIIDPHSLHVLGSGILTSSGTNAIQYLACCVNPATIVNDGTMQISGGDLTVHAVEVEQNGTLETAAGADLVDDGAPATAADGASYSGAGRWLVEDVGALTLAGTQTLGSGFHLALGDGQTGATLGGTATLTGPGGVDWIGGTIQGHLTIAHGTTLSASGTTNNNGKRFLSGSTSAGASTLTNHGSISFADGAGMMTGYVAKLTNSSDGRISLAPGTTFSTLGCCVNPNKVINAGGQLVVPSGSSTDPVLLDGVAYEDTAGTASIHAGDTLQLNEAPSSLTGTSVSGGGTLGIAAPTSVSGTDTIGSGSTLALSTGGSLDGTATVGGSGRTTWTGGSVSGQVTIATSGGVTASGTDLKTIANIAGGPTPSKVTLKVPFSIAAGTADHHDTVDVGQSALYLTGTTTLADNTDLTDGTVRNSGRLTVAAGKGGLALRGGDGSFVNSNQVTVSSGTWQLTGDYRQTAGDTNLATGTALNRLYTSYTVTIAGGRLDGTGTVGAGIDNTGGTVRPGGASTGTLHVTGSYVQGRHGALALDLGTRSHDHLVVTGSASVAGVVHATNHGTQRPRIGAKVGVVTAAPLTAGSICVTTAGTGRTAGHWAVAHTGTTLQLVWRAGRARSC